MGLGGLVVAGIGLGGYLQAGSVSSLGQVNSIIMMAAGGGCGIVFLIIGIVGSIKNHRTNSGQHYSGNDSDEDELPSHLLHAAMPLNSWYPTEEYFDEAKKLIDNASDFSAKAPHSFMVLEHRYLQRKDVVLFAADTLIMNIDLKEEPLAFGLTLPVTLNENEIPTIQNYLEGVIEKMRILALSKVFVHMIAAEPQIKNFINHSLLFVIEPHPADVTQAKLTAIDSFGTGGGYQKYADMFFKMGKQFFSSSHTTTVKNPVCQQEDGWSCGWQTVENIELLSKVDNVQDFVNNKSLPVRSAAKIRSIYEHQYKKYARAALRNKL